jgi:6-phosphogluconolactonase
VACYAIDADGSLGARTAFVQLEGTGVNAERQEAAHAHQSVVSPCGQWVFTPDLGSDKLVQMALGADGSLSVVRKTEAAVPGHGPRHIAFHPGGKFAYLINEMGNSVSTFAYDADSGQTTLLQDLSSVPDGWTGVQPTCVSLTASHCADIHVSADGRFVYGSNRGHDSIAIYSVGQEGEGVGTLTLVGFEPCGGSVPRNFQLTASGDFLLVANQDTHNIATFKVRLTRVANLPNKH